jgi:membrane protein YdbS with pleckstrin-like domain
MTRYRFDEITKAVVALLTAAVALAAFFVTFDPALGAALIAVVIAAANVVGVFVVKNKSRG